MIIDTRGPQMEQKEMMLPTVQVINSHQKGNKSSLKEVLESRIDPIGGH